MCFGDGVRSVISKNIFSKKPLKFTIDFVTVIDEQGIVRINSKCDTCIFFFFFTRQ